MTAGITTGLESRLAEVRAFVARELLDTHDTPASLGEVTLHAHQRRAAARVAALLRSHGGALLADPTGLGKTFVALAAARGFQRILIGCPAALRDLWLSALHRTHARAPVVSFEQLSRRTPDWLDSADLVILDESHHLRNPLTRRYAAVAELCDRARVLLLTATPIQNRREDLVAQVALFLGDAAFAMNDAELTRFVVRRRGDESAAPLPRLVGPAWISVTAEDDVLDDLMALPTPIPLADEGRADALVRYTLLRQWSSSRAALVAGLRRRLAAGLALVAALQAGRVPTRRDLAAWPHTADTLQLAIPELLVPLGKDEGAPLSELLASAEDHVAALRRLLRRLREAPDPDPARSEALRALSRRHPGSRMIAFSQYAETVRAIARLLMPSQPGVAELTARGARVIGGRLRRRDVLAQFAPRAVVSSAERIQILVATDVLSEGLDLQEASLIVHLDLPWNPARLEQRVGRVRRLGARHEAVFVYALAPPARSERVLEVESRLRAKLGVAARLVGVGQGSLPDIDDPEGEPVPERTSGVYAMLERWRTDTQPEISPDREPLCAGVRAPADGALVLLAAGVERWLLADIGDGPTTDAAAVATLASMALGRASVPSEADIARVTSACADWWCRRAARASVRGVGPAGARARSRLASRITALLASAPRHERGRWARLASEAQQTLSAPLGIGAERRLQQLVGSAADGESWLASVAAIGRSRGVHSPGGTPAVRAVILFRRDSG